MQIRGVILGLLNMVLLGAGVALVAFFFLGQDSENTAMNSSDPKGFNVPEIENTESAEAEVTGGPDDNTLPDYAQRLVVQAELADEA